MILFLTNSKTTNLLDFLTDTNEDYAVHKIQANIDMRYFAVGDMANYSHFAEIIINRDAVVNDDETLVQTIEEFHTMYDARITIIAPKLAMSAPLFKDLLTIGVGNIITSENLVEIQKDIVKCLSETGLNRYEVKPRPKPKLKQEHYRFNCENIAIAVVGSQSRIGTTTFALGLTNWLSKVGAKVCYIEANTNNILPAIAKEYGVDGATENFAVDNMEFAKGKPSMSGNFHIFDFGTLSENNFAKFEQMELLVLTCGVKIYELPYTAFSLQKLSQTSAYILPTFFGDDTMTRYENLFANPMHQLLQPVYQPDFMNNELAKVNYKKIIEKYIVAE